MFKTGPEKFKLLSSQGFSIKADDIYKLYGIVNGERVSFIGPHTDIRKTVFSNTLYNFEEIEVSTKKATCYDIDVFSVAKVGEDLDPTPIEVAIDRPLTIKEQLRAMVHQELSMQAIAPLLLVAYLSPPLLEWDLNPLLLLLH